MSRKANRKINRKTTVRPTQTSQISEAVTLETPKATVHAISEAVDLSWLAADVFSTASGYRS